MSKIEVDEIVKQSGSTLTLGGPGTAVTLGSGATQTGFGRTGTVDWQTTVKTSGFTAASGEGYFVNTTSGEIIVNLPAGSAGAIIAIKDYAGTFDTNTCRLNPNGSDKINGVNDDAYLTQQGLSVTLVFIDSTKGWLAVNDSTDDTTGIVPAFVAASGGTETTSGDFKIHTFNSDATFTVSNGGNSAGSNKIEFLVVGGGGAGGADEVYTGAGGGGAGGYRFSPGTAAGSYTAGPAPLGGTALTLCAAAYPITVGAGGSGGTPDAQNPGSPSVFSTITSTGGGAGGAKNHPGPFNNVNGDPGGSGGGAHQAAKDNPAGGALGFGVGNTPPVSPPQGNNGGGSPFPAPGAPYYGGGGGGGASAVGTTGTPTQGGPGGAGLTSCISGSPVARGGGGGGGVWSASPGGNAGTGGTGGGGNANDPGSGANGSAGTVNTGGGGGGASGSPVARAGGSGGSGVVIIRYKFQ
jgi:hypothetical protein